MSNTSNENERELNLHVETHNARKDRLTLYAYDDLYIKNVVSRIQGSGTIGSDDIRMIYISENRICIELVNGIEFSIPVKGSELF